MEPGELDFAAQEGEKLLDVEGFALVGLSLETVFLVEAHHDVVVCFREVVNDTIDVRLDVFWTLYKEMLVCTNVQCVGNAKVIPQELLEGRILVNP